MIEPGGDDADLDPRLQRHPEHGRHSTQRNTPHADPLGVDPGFFQHFIQEPLHSNQLDSRQARAGQAAEPFQAIATLDAP